VLWSACAALLLLLLRVGCWPDAARQSVLLPLLLLRLVLDDEVPQCLVP